MQTQTTQHWVFISHVEADRDYVERIKYYLEASNISCRSSLTDGASLQEMGASEIIEKCCFFVACFPGNFQNIHETSMHQELLQAVEELRKRHSDSGWLIPIRLSDEQLPKLNVGAGTNLSDLQAIDLFSDFDGGIRKLRNVILNKIGCSHDWQVVSRKNGENRKIDETMMGFYGRVMETWHFEYVVTSKCKFCDVTKTHKEYETKTFQD